MTDEIKWLAASLETIAAVYGAEMAAWCVPRLKEAAAALTLSDEARVRAERGRDEALKLMSQYAREAGEATGRLEMSEAAGIVDGWRERTKASEALVRELAEGLRPFAEGGRQVPSSASDTATCAYYRDAIFKAGDFRKAQALILRAEGEGSSRAEIAASDAARPDCSAAQSLDGGEG